MEADLLTQKVIGCAIEVSLRQRSVTSRFFQVQLDLGGKA